MKQLIQDKAKTHEMTALATTQGMRTLLQDGIEKVLQGHTTHKQVKAVAPEVTGRQASPRGMVQEGFTTRFGTDTIPPR